LLSYISIGRILLIVSTENVEAKSQGIFPS
jgi:hypothetical protein